MEIKILDKKKEGSATCYLAKIAMNDYLQDLPDNYKDWNIQRGIVNNHYLDKLIDTILQSKHIPPLVLTTDNVEVNDNVGTISHFQVLDGLQRTHRLKLIYNSVNFIIENPSIISDAKLTNILKAVRSHSSSIKDANASSPIIRKLLSEVDAGKDLGDIFNFNQWVEVWENLSVTEQVNKMLLLNAGHKSVNKKHQIEIIFHNILSKLEEEVEYNFNIVRERNISSISINKNRPVGQFSFSHIVSGMLSLDQAKPVTINSNLLSKVQEDIDNYSLSYDEILLLCRFLAELDSSLESEFGATGLKWLGKEVVVSGLFGAIGLFTETHELTIEQSLDIARDKLINNPRSLSLPDFDNARNNLDISKINIGKINKLSVTNAIVLILEDRTNIINWNRVFAGDFNE
ncbi:hypothetical protein BH581_08370 [Vibrio splendidus]|uniref:hypothetical protein n=1 Tax=Vibrio splendidus TaxID=29497 RepID=UPI000976D0B0|nr:hypothetical protein [Vibrio splendidus]OMO29586.1 hypothetical protein BH581_08370 [Vibrio splendidus]